MTQTPEDVVRAYVKAFESLDAAYVIPFYRLPCMFLTRHGSHVVADTGAAGALVGTLIEQAQAQRYHRTVVSDVEVRPLGEGLAWIGGVFSRLDSNDQEIARFGFAYTMLSEGGIWRIAVAVAHEVQPLTGERQG